jgi:hypothetical protein
MTSREGAGDRILSALRSQDGKGVVTAQDRFDTGIDDLWAAITEPARLARWLGEVAGDLRLGGAFRAHFSLASGWEGAGRVEDLAAYIAGGTGNDFVTRWSELHPAYEELAAGIG